MKSALLIPAAALAAGLGLSTQDAQEPGRVLSERCWHLGDDQTPEWSEAPETPDHPTELLLRFEAAADPGERTLELRTRHVDNEWTVSLNGTRLGVLERLAPRSLQRLPIPGGTLRDGDNELRIAIGRTGDDITIGDLRLLDRGYRAIYDILPLRVQVRDAASGAGMPGRITVVDADGRYAPLYYPGLHATPTREGFAYADATGNATLELAAGRYTVYATRGMEWSVSGADIELAEGESAALALEIAHEVETHGYAALDTHLHTYTYSGHGDASVDERVLSIAGEGLDIAIATDHNHNTDYRPRLQALGLDGTFLAVTGNEVTTPIGHFNAFPLRPGDAVPLHDSEDIQALAAGMREKGAQVVILNHPRWPDAERGPFGVSALDPRTGIFADGLQLPVDAIEVYNSTVVETHWRVLMQDWFGLLNHGVLVRGVGSSDSHTVTDPAGQGRTYVATAADPPRAEDLDALCRAVREGNTTMSQGLYLEVSVAGMPPGALIAAPDPGAELAVRVACASWARVAALEVWVDGTRVARYTDLPAEPGKATDLALPLSLPDLPPHDCWVVVVAEGPKPDGPWWYTLQDELSAISNPVFLDRDLDGRWASPFLTAERLLEAYGDDPAALAEALDAVDDAVRAQVDALQAVHAPTPEPEEQP